MVYKDKMVVQTYIPIDLYEQLKALADNEDRSISNYVKKIIEQHIKETKTVS